MNAHSVYHESFPVDWSTVTVHWSKPDMRKVREVITGFAIGLMFFALSFTFCVQAARADQANDVACWSEHVPSVVQAFEAGKVAVGRTEDGFVYAEKGDGGIIRVLVLCTYGNTKASVVTARVLGSDMKPRAVDVVARSVSRLFGVADRGAVSAAIERCLDAASKGARRTEGGDFFGSAELGPIDLECALGLRQSMLWVHREVD